MVLMQIVHAKDRFLSKVDPLNFLKISGFLPGAI